MIKDDCLIKFQGFHPSELTEFYLSEKFNAIYDEAPYGASLNVVLTKNKNYLKGVVTVHSQAGPFFAVASETSLREVVHSLNDQLRKQFKKWKHNRFKRQSLKDLRLEENTYSAV